MNGSSRFAMNSLERNKPYIAMVFVQLVYAGMALFSKAAMAKGMNPYVFVAYRQAFASLSLAPFALYFDRKKTAPLSYHMLWKIFFVSLLGITFSLNLYYFAMNYTTATFAAASTNAIPAITFGMAILFRLETISIRESHGMAKVLGAISSLVGALVFAFVKGPPIKFIYLYLRNQKEIPSSSLNCFTKWECVKGSLLMLLANTFWSLWLIMQGSLIKQYPAKVRLTTLLCWFSCIQSAVWAIVVERDMSSWRLGWDANLLSVAYCGIIVTGMTYWLSVWTIEKKGPVFTAMFTPLSLIVTVIFSAFIWREILHLGSVFGAILLILGLYGFLWGKNREVKGEVDIEEISVETKQETTLECITHH